jgi:hypothetical protein
MGDEDIYTRNDRFLADVILEERINEESRSMKEAVRIFEERDSSLRSAWQVPAYCHSVAAARLTRNDLIG